MLGRDAYLDGLLGRQLFICFPFGQDLWDFFHRDWGTKKIALQLVTAECNKKLMLITRFNAFGCRCHSKSASNAYYGLDDNDMFGARCKIHDKRTIHLDLVEGEISQI